MKTLQHTLIVGLLTVLCLVAEAQKYDYNWLASYQSKWGYDSGWQHWFGTTRFDFRQNPVLISRDSLGINFDKSNSAISNRDGDLLFYCNGITIRNSSDEIVENGDSLGWGYFLSNFAPANYSYGMPYNQFHIVLPNPKSSNLYDIFYLYIDTFVTGANIAAKKLLKTGLDITGNNGHISILTKDVDMFSHEINFAVAANKHANGRDWWICTYRTNTSCYDIALYNGSDSLLLTTQCGGGAVPHGSLSSMRFSPDGSKFVIASTNGAINFFDFDRCNGTLTLLESYLDAEIRDSSFWWPGAVEFSPDSRFAYVFCNFRIFQFDMQAIPISSSKTVVGSFAGFNGPFQQLYYHAQLAPDGKIYTNSGNTNFYIGVIDNPNGQGATCNFLDHSIELPTFIGGLPYYPNYRLGPLLGSPCDTLGLGMAQSEKERQLTIYPNPASDYITIDYGYTNWAKGNIDLEILNALGQIVYAQTLPSYSGFQKVHINTLPQGYYVVRLKSNGEVVAGRPFVKE